MIAHPPDAPLHSLPRLVEIDIDIMISPTGKILCLDVFLFVDFTSPFGFCL